MPSGVHDSALLVNAYRARKESISLDPFAKLWISTEVERWTDQYMRQVSETEVLVHALRHRFFLERLTEFLNTTPNGVFVNIGAGFTSYPYLLPDDISCCEVDSAINIDFKTQKIAEFEANGLLPKRSVHYLTVRDLNDRSALADLGQRLKTWIDGRPSFVLFEGVFFYLDIDAIAFIYEVLGAIQQANDIVASTSFRPEETEKDVFQQLVNYCHTDLNMPGFAPNALATSFYANRPHYTLTLHTNYYALAQQFSPDEPLENPAEILEEDCYILKHV